MKAPEGTVLVVEDDAGLRFAVQQILRREGFRVHAAASGSEAIVVARESPPHVVVLDLGLPDMSGYEVMAQLRESSSVPVLMLTGRDAPSDRVHGLEQGADDYLVKPASLLELAARVRALLRRAPPQPDRLQCGSVEVDVDARRVTVAGEQVELTRLELDLLVYLLRRRGEARTRGQILEDVWKSSPDYQTDAVVTEYVRRLRIKLGDLGITTLRGVGYRYDPVAGDGDPPSETAPCQDL